MVLEVIKSHVKNRGVGYATKSSCRLAKLRLTLTEIGIILCNRYDSQSPPYFHYFEVSAHLHFYKSETWCYQLRMVLTDLCVFVISQLQLFIAPQAPNDTACNWLTEYI